MSPENWLGVAIVFTLGIVGMRTFRNVLLQLLSFLIPVLVAASVAGFHDLVEGVLATVLAVLVLALSASVGLVAIFGYKLLRKIARWTNQLDESTKD